MNADSDKTSAPRHQVKHIRNVRIPVRDGTRLAADLFIPDVIADQVRRGAQSKIRGPAPAGDPKSKINDRFPALLEYLPYRKDDNTAPRWDAHDYFAARGYVGVRLDVRGTGDS